MQKHLINFKRSSGKLINQIKAKLKMVKQDSLFNSIIGEGSTSGTNENIKLENATKPVIISSKNIPTLCENLEQFIHEIKTSMNFEYLVFDYPFILEKRLENSVQELECMLREIKNAHDNIQKQKTQQKLVDKEKLSLNRTLKKLKDNEIREMETIVSLFDNPMYIRWQGVKSTRKADVLERFLSDIKSKQLALDNLNTLVSRKLTNLTMFSSSMENNGEKKLFTKAIPLPFPTFESTDLSVISLPSTPSPLSLQTNSIMPVSSHIPTRTLRQRAQQIEQRNSLAGSDRSMAAHLRPSTTIRTMNQDAVEMLEYPFITMQQYPPGFIINLGGLVSARSVKLIEKLSNLEEPEGRDAWWTEIRMEVRSHARALGCNVVLGYKEEISICDDVCVLNASGTAAVINLLNSNQDQDILNRNASMTMMSSMESDKCQSKLPINKSERVDDPQIISTQQQQQPQTQTQQQASPQQINNSIIGKITRIPECNNDNETSIIILQSSCNYCHLPYSETSVPFKVDVSKCGVCRRAKVPDVLFTTIELPENIPITGRGVFLQATVCKCKRDLRGELNAKEISDCLPFLEYELHSLLLNKLKVKGMNAIFGLRVQISIGERFIVGMAVGTAVFLTALPTPLIPKISSGNSWHNDEQQLNEIQRALIETVKRNRELYYLKSTVINNDIDNGRFNITTSDTDESDDDLPDLDLGVGKKDACILEVDDVEDMDRINLLIDEKTPDDFHIVNTEIIPGLDDLEIVRNLQMFTQVSRAKIPSGQYSSMPSKYFARMLQTVFFKLRRMVPCALCDMQFKVALTDQDEIQLSVVGMALGLGEPTKLINKHKRNNNINYNNNKGIINSGVKKDLLKNNEDNDLIFKLDEDQGENAGLIFETIDEKQQQLTTNSSPVIGQVQRPTRPRSPLKSKAHMSQYRHKHVPLKERYGVDITPLSYLPGGRIDRYLGNLNFFFIRECTSIRESGGLSGFTHSFITEVLAICRAHITALGGNAMVAFFMTQCELLHSPHKNQH
ncbi:hypothetical protein PV327_008714 [Microctonus hyperodae]|uniref:Uncharacterized protein n=1 Tax=Microctonus hyperodae TaxID=165561 RepID=A0AA39KHS0_MICHY|nr:hypothetical protein PV327_008714 [Microctonus hyperodae]